MLFANHHSAMAMHAARTLRVRKFLPFSLPFSAVCCSSLCPLRSLATIQPLVCIEFCFAPRASEWKIARCVSFTGFPTALSSDPTFPTLFGASPQNARVDDPSCVAGRQILSPGLFMLTARKPAQRFRVFFFCIEWLFFWGGSGGPRCNSIPCLRSPRVRLVHAIHKTLHTSIL